MRFSIGLASLLLLALFELPSASGATLFMSAAEGPGPSGFVGNLNRNQTTASYSLSGSAGTPHSLDTFWSAAADLTAGTLRAVATGSNNGLDPTIQHGDMTAISFFADTFTIPLITPGQWTVNIAIDGTYRSSTTGLGTVINSSTMILYFLKPGSLDQSNIGAAQNIIEKATFGVGPGFQDNPYFTYGPLAGTIGLGGTAHYSIATDKLVDGFQLLILLQPYIVASTGQDGAGTFDYSMDMGNTAHFSLDVPAGTVVEAAGGLPIGSPIPEPGSWVLGGMGLLAVAVQRRRQRSH